MKKLRIILILLAVAAFAFAARTLPLGHWALTLVEWMKEAGPMGVVAFVVSYVAASVFFLPASILTLGSGFVYGPLWGTLLVSPASVLGATIAFVLGRSVARNWIASRVAQNKKFAAIDEAVGRDGFKIVLLLRLSPVFPFVFLNYALGLTKVKLRDFVLASAIGMLPGTFLYVYLGSLITNVAQLLSGKPGAGGHAQQILLVVGLIATIAVTTIITRTARKALDQALAEDAEAPTRTSQEAL